MGFFVYTFEKRQQASYAESAPAVGEKKITLSVPDSEVTCRAGATTPVLEAT